jgi:hypothetical protein
MNSTIFARCIVFLYLCAHTYAACENMAGGAVTYTGSDGTTHVGCKGTLKAVVKSTSTSQCANGELAIWINEAAGTTSIYDFILSTGQNANGFTFNAPISATKITGTDLDIVSLQCTDCVKTSSIADNAITLAQMTSNSVNSVKIVDYSINYNDIANNAIRTNAILDRAVTSNKIALGSITSSHLNYVPTFSQPRNTYISNQLQIYRHLYVGPGNQFYVQSFNNWHQGGWAAQVQLNGFMRIRGYGIGFSSARMSYTLTYLHNWGRYTGRDAIWGNYYRLSLWTDRSIMSKTFVGASDRRIKKNITSIPDNVSLGIIRKLDTKYYHYIDEVSRGTNRTIGFIAQDVREHIPEAVSIMKNFIPNEMRVIRPVWVQLPNGNFTTTVDDLKSEEPGKYRVMVDVKVNGTTSENEFEWMTGNDGKTFESDIPYEEVFLYGREVDDFHAIDKQKIFAVAYSALQQVDKIQQSLVEKVATLEATVASLTERLEALEAR